MDYVQEYSPEESAAIEHEFTRLNGKHYMDHAGTTLYAESQIRAVHDLLSANLFCNPHTSRLTGELMNQVRDRVLRFFNTRSSEYSLVFTSGATGSLKLVAENFIFRPDNCAESDEGAFVYLRDNHTSVLGMRAVVGTNRIDPLQREDFLRHMKLSGSSAQRRPSLLVFPAQNNFNAAKYPLDLIEEVQQNGLIGYNDERFYVCLDAASYVSTNFLDLGRYKPDYVCMSFYKIFGYPTGLGALLIRNGSEEQLEKKYYGGGTIKILLSGQNLHMMHDSLVERFEDGTQPFLSIISLLEGLNAIQRLVPPTNGYRSMERVSKHVFNLAKYAYKRLATLAHANGNKVIRFYMDSNFESRDRQGGIVNFNVLRDDGSYVGFAEFAQVAGKHEIYIRTGCFCNAGSCQRQLGLSDEDVLMFFKMGKICGDDTDMIEGQPTGTVRASFGYMTKRENVDRLVQMIDECFTVKSISKTSAVAANQERDLVLKSIYIYPIRSCGAFVVSSSWPLSDRCLKHDREFTIVDSNGNPLSPSKHPDMLSIVSKIDPRSNLLVLTHPMMSDFILSINKILTEAKPSLNDASSIDCGEAAAEWISQALRTPRLRLVRMSPFSRSPAKILIINANALRSLGDENGSQEYSPVAWLVQHFRGNLVFEAPPQLDMQTWKHVVIGESRFKLVGICNRCPMIHVNQGGTNGSAESLKVIANVFSKKVPLGVFLVHIDDGGANRTVKCGDIIVPMAPIEDPRVTVITESVSRYNFVTAREF